MSATVRRSLLAALPAVLALSLGLAPTARADEAYVPPARVRIHHDGSPAASIQALLEAGGDVVAHGKDWFDVLVPQDQALSGDAFLGLADGDRFEVVEENVDLQLEPFKGVEDVGVYHTYAEVKAEIDALVAARPDLVSTESIGQTWEGRPIHAVRISGGADSANLPTFLICGLHHSREWISVEVPMGLVHLLVEQYDSDPAIKQIVDSREIWVVPVLNPDGLEYSQTQYKMWRKNRRHNEDGSYGVDPNRNWGYKWGGAGASTSPSADTYRGPSAMSEPEIQAVRDLALREKPVASLSFHSYSELILWPWSYDYVEAPDNDVLAYHARKMAALNGYTAEKSTELYPSSGDFDDWFYGELGAISYTFELGKQFVPSESQVPGIVEANLKAVRYFLENCADPFPLMTHSPLAATTKPEGPFQVSVTLSQRYQASDPVAEASLVYSLPGSGATTTVALTKNGPSYQGAIPGDGFGTYEYHFEVTENSGKTHRYPAQGRYGFQVVEQLFMLVDDDKGKDYEKAYAEALQAAGVPFSVTSSEQLVKEDLLGASGVIWLCGDDSSSSLDDREQALVQAYLAAGGEFLLFGQDIGYDLKGSAFMKNWMKADFVADKADGTTLAGAAGSFLEGATVTINQGDGVKQQYPEAIKPREGAATLLDYQGTGQQGAVAVAGDYRLAYFGVGLEGIDGAANRAAVLGKALAWMAADGASRRLHRAEALRSLGGADSRPRELARLEAGVLDAVRELGARRDVEGMRRLLQGVDPSIARQLVRAFRQTVR